MVKFYISKDKDGNIDAQLCEKLNDDGTYDELFISHTGDRICINLRKRYVKPMSQEFEWAFKETDGTEFIKEYMQSSTSFQRMATCMFSNVNKQT